MQALVIDDSSSMRLILKEIMNEVGFDVLTAKDGQEALEVLEKNGVVDLALVDWNMPVMNGFEFTKEVRSQERYDDIKLLMVTTESELSKVVDALGAGVNEYLMKPFTKEAVVEKLQILGISIG